MDDDRIVEALRAIRDRLAWIQVAVWSIVAGVWFMFGFLVGTFG